MFLVGGSILVHGVPAAGHAIAAWAAGFGGLAGALFTMAADGLVGVAAGAVVLGVVELAKKILKK
jgi:hypothetical protein